MKRIIKYTVFAILAITIVSCSKSFLEEETYGLIRPADYFETVDDLEKGVNGIYDFMNLMFNQTATLTPCMGGDDVTTLPGGNKEGYKQFDVFSAQDNNDRMGEMWNGCYLTIKQANIIFANIDNIVEPLDDPDFLAKQKQHAIGQAHFARALSYFFLVRMWGEVPLVTDLNVNYEIERSPFIDIYDQIVADLTAAESKLPATKSDYVTDHELNSTHARPHKGTAKALLASVYLNMAGYPVKDESKYALAAAKAKEVIDNEATYGYALMSDFADLWIQDNNINAETVFGCHYSHTAPVWHWSSGNMTAPLAYLPGDVGGWDDIFAELTFFNEYPDGPRKDATFITKAQKNPDSPVLDWTEFAMAHPYYKKWVYIPGFEENNMSKWIDWWSSRTVMIVRYAEVLLVYAEAQAMSEAPDASAYSAVNRVRERAGLPDLASGLSATDFQNAIVQERAWEFAGNEPCARWFDMVRTETVESATAKRDAAEIPIVNTPTKARYFAPIPQSDKLINPNLGD